MSKAILVLPVMPSSCGTCKLEKNNHCCITGKWINTVVRPVDKCPLRPMPEKKDICGTYPKADEKTPSYFIGFNDCLKAIEGSGEDD